MRMRMDKYFVAIYLLSTLQMDVGDTPPDQARVRDIQRLQRTSLMSTETQETHICMTQRHSYKGEMQRTLMGALGSNSTVQLGPLEGPSSR